MPDPSTSAYDQLAHELANNPALISALLAEHTAGEAYCPACTHGGTGRALTAAPCSIRRLALLARDYRRAAEQ